MIYNADCEVNYEMKGGYAPIETFDRDRNSYSDPGSNGEIEEISIEMEGMDITNIIEEYCPELFEKILKRIRE